ncbi:hypothetical protein GCM10027047_05960 [Rhodococcus aerolatus]
MEADGPRVAPCTAAAVVEGADAPTPVAPLPQALSAPSSTTKATPRRMHTMDPLVLGHLAPVERICDRRRPEHSPRPNGESRVSQNYLEVCVRIDEIVSEDH